MPPVLRYAGFGNEAIFGDPVEAAFHVDIQSASLDTPSGTETYYQGGIGRGLRTRRPGFYAPSGNIVYGWDIRTIAAMLRWVLGGYAFTGDTPHNLHEMWGTAESILPSFTARIGKDVFEHIFAGCVADKLELDLASDILQASMDVVAAKDSKGTLTEEADLLLPEEFPLAFHEVTATLDAGSSEDISAKVRALKLTIANGVKAESGRGIGSRFPRRLVAGGRDITGGLDLYFENLDHLEAFWGGATGPADSGSVDMGLAINATAGADGSLALNLPSVHFSKVSLPVSGRDEVKQSTELRAMTTDIVLDDGVTTVRSELLASVLNDADDLEAIPS
jgi:hypothetical protein